MIIYSIYIVACLDKQLIKVNLYIVLGKNSLLNLNIFFDFCYMKFKFNIINLSFSQHQAAVKALDWCPWQTNILASGGGTADRHIRFWNCNNGQCVNSVNANSQVCAILWSKTYRELVSAHGFANNQLTIWKYPSMTKVK